jgi:hypothetical protein
MRQNLELRTQRMERTPMAIGRTRQLWLAAAAVTVAATAIAVPASLGRAASVKPTVRLLTGVRHIEAQRFGSGSHLYLPEAVYVAAVHGAFEVDATRHHGRIRLEQVSRSGSKVNRLRHIKTSGPANFLQGIPNFFHLVLTDSAGKVVTQSRSNFCPGADFTSQRVSPTSVDNPTFPQECGDYLTQSTVWGINDGWAVAPFFTLTASPSSAPDGNYTLTVSITPRYAKELNVAPKDRKSTLSLKVVTGGGCVDICPGQVARRHARSSGGGSRSGRSLRGTALPVQHNSGGLPDLVSLPAHGLSTSHAKQTGADFLNFGATIWNSGPGTFDVEGFRVNGRPTMKARQYIYRHGRSVRSVNIGHFEFDTRAGHHHWHLSDVARYDLLDAKGHRVVLSHKQSFCLAPTDPINLTKPGALWNPSSVGLESSCPTDQSLWLRETLPVGWGDTYIQRKGGQAFTITDVPNGRYEIRVTTNPHGNIRETTRKNNTSLLPVRLGGTPGHRTVTRVG